MYDEGHEIKNRTYTPVNLTMHTPEKIIEEITQLELVVEEIIVVKPALNSSTIRTL